MVTEIKYYLECRDKWVENKTVGKYPRYLKAVVCLYLLGLCHSLDMEYEPGI